MKFILIFSLIMVTAFTTPTKAEIKHYNNEIYINNSSLIDKQLDLNNDNKTERIILQPNSFKIYNSHGQELLTQSFDEFFFETNTSNIEFLDIDGDTTKEIILSFREKDTTGQVLSYYIYKYINDEVKLIKSEKDLYKGKIEFKDNKLIETTPVYEDGDSNATPSKKLIKTYTIANDIIEEEKTEILPNDNNNNLTKDITKKFNINAVVYSNPDENEMAKLLEQVAYEKGIPSVLLKALAFQESSWRQFSNGQPLITRDGGIGIMQVTIYDWEERLNKPEPLTDAEREEKEHIYRLINDPEYNIRAGADILLEKFRWSGTSYVSKVGNMDPQYLENWYFAIWAYNTVSNINNPADKPEPYQTKIINLINMVNPQNSNDTIVKRRIRKDLNDKQLMTDLYQYNKEFFVSGSGARDLPDYPQLSSDKLLNGDFRKKTQGIKTIVTSETLSVRDKNRVKLGDYHQSDIIEISSNPLMFDDGYLRYEAKQDGTSLKGWVASNWAKPIGDVNYDRYVDIYDLVKISKKLNTATTTKDSQGYPTNTDYLEKYDMNGDNIIDIKDISLAAQNYNKHIYVKP